MKKFYKKKYWDIYYKNISKNFRKFNPSSFAVFIKKKYLDKSINLLEMGCGNGRDTFFFHGKVNNIIAIDSSSEAINKNKEIVRVNRFKIKFINKTFEKINYKQYKKINFVYLRFFLHAITLQQENILMGVFKKILKRNPNTIFALEFRTLRDNLMRVGKKISKYERYTDHYRRFINVSKFKNKLKKYNFKIIYFKQGINLSKTKLENPYLCRLVFKNV